MHDIVLVDFHGDNISTVKDEQSGKMYCIPREICLVLGVSGSSQRQKLTKSQLYQKHTRRVDINSPSGIQETLLLDIDMLPSWLTSISPDKVKPAVQEKLLIFQEECAKALRDYWLTGKAERQSDPTDKYPQLRAIRELATATAIALDKAEAAEKKAEKAEALAESTQRAVGELVDAKRMTIEHFVLSNSLVRQFPPHTWKEELPRRLKGYCQSYGLDIMPIPVTGKTWPTENAYPLEAFAWLLRHPQEKKNPLLHVAQHHRKA